MKEDEWTLLLTTPNAARSLVNVASVMLIQLPRSLYLTVLSSQLALTDLKIF